MTPHRIANPLVATPHTAKSGSGRILARIPAGKGHNGRVVLLDGALVKLFRRVDKSETDEVWSHAAASDYVLDRPVDAMPAVRPEPVKPTVSKPPRPRRVLASYEPVVTPEPAPIQEPAVRVSPTRERVAGLVSAYANEADERADCGDHDLAERRAAAVVVRLFRKLAADIRAGRVEV